MGCGSCKTLHCNCKTCITRYPNEPKQVTVGSDKVMCPECGEVYHFEDNVWLVNDYGRDSHEFFNSLKEAQ